MAKGTPAPARPTAITSLKESPVEGKRNWLIYGGSGAGKTVLAGTAPNALFLTVEAAGTESAKAAGSGADEWVIDEWDTLGGDAYNYFKNGSGCQDYEWVILDSGSEMEELAWQAHLAEAHDRNRSRSIFQPAIQDYQIIGNKMKRMVNLFNRLPINVLYTFQTMRLTVEDDDNEDDTTLLLPLVGSPNNGVLSQKICGMVTLIGLLTVRQGEEDKSYRQLWVEGTKRFQAKDRHWTFGRFLNEPNIAEMAKAVDARQAGGPQLETPKTIKRNKKGTQDDGEG